MAQFYSRIIFLFNWISLFKLIWSSLTSIKNNFNKNSIKIFHSNQWKFYFEWIQWSMKEKMNNFNENFIQWFVEMEIEKWIIVHHSEHEIRNDQIKAKFYSNIFICSPMKSFFFEMKLIWKLNLTKQKSIQSFDDFSLWYFLNFFAMLINQIFE